MVTLCAVVIESGKVAYMSEIGFDDVINEADEHGSLMKTLKFDIIV